MKLRSRGRFNVKRWTRLLADRVRGNEFERALRSARDRGSHDYVFCWNRGLGDVALGLVPLFARIRAQDPDSRIIAFTRAELAEIFTLAGVEGLHIVAGLSRGEPFDPNAAAAQATSSSSAAIPTAPWRRPSPPIFRLR